MMESTERKELIRRMVDKGLTYQLIGEILGISRQRAHQILSGYKPSKASVKASKKHYEDTHPEQVKEVRRRYYQENRDRILEREKERYARLKQEVE